MKKVVVVGAGAAGLMAAGTAAQNGNKVLLIEKKDRAGRKILITGKGRCNITNIASDIKELIDNTPNNGRFLFSSFSKFSNYDTIDFFEQHGLSTKVERGGRVFPQSDKAADVVDALRRYNINNNVEFMYHSPVSEILAKDNQIKGVILKDGKTIGCDSVILCTGGKSYPGTGSTGDGYKMAKKLGHTITQLSPSLVPLQIHEKYCKEMEGLSLKNISIKIKNNKENILYEDFGEMVFTWFGVSGPVILSASSHILNDKIDGLKLYIDLKPALTEEKLNERILRDFEKYTRKLFKNSLDDLLPQKIIPIVIELSKIDPLKHINQITKDERRTLVQLIKAFPLTISSLRPIEEAIITRGGISINEINPATMESKLIKGLYFAGEIIDVDAYTGGFNLTIAFSTGYVAGINA